MPIRSLPLLFLLAACDQAAPSSSPADDAGTLFLWIGADRDAFTTCSLSTSCTAGGPNNALAGEIQVANEEQLEQKRGYVHFALPTLPADAVIERAYLELYNPATMGDGRSDDLCIPVVRLLEPWDPFTLDWQNQPLTSAMGGDSALSLRSNAWSSADVTVAVREHYADPATNHGFALYVPAGVQADKGFYSNNATSRTVDELGLAPRLLLEVTSKRGGELRFPQTLDQSTDLPFRGASTLMGRAVLADDWPDDWAVVGDDGRCL